MKEDITINKSSSQIIYEDEKEYWEADIIFNMHQKEILILGTSRNLSDIERSNIITKILNSFAFGNLLNKEDNIYLFKLKNRGEEKKEEQKIKDEMSYSIIGEDVLELPPNKNDHEMITCLRNLFLNLKLETVNFYNNMKIKGTIENSVKVGIVSFEFFGTKSEYNQFIKIFTAIKAEYENAISKNTGRKILLDFKKGILQNKHAVTTFYIKEAN